MPKKNDIVLLYLSIDRPDDDAKWRKMAAHYDLMGEHVRAQEAFKKEIYDTSATNVAHFPFLAV